MDKFMPSEIWVSDDLNIYNDPGIFGGIDGKTLEKYIRADLVQGLVEALDDIRLSSVSQPAALNMPSEAWAWKMFYNLQEDSRQALDSFCEALHG